MARGNRGRGKEGDEGWFKRVNTSQLRSRRTLLGHWSDRDALHPLSRPPPPPTRTLSLSWPGSPGALSSTVLYLRLESVTEVRRSGLNVYR